MTCVWCLTVDNSQLRWFFSWESRFDCQQRVTHEDMCVHKNVCKKGFHEYCFQPRRFARVQVEGSTFGWTPPSVAETGKAILGCSPGESLVEPNELQ